MAEHANFYWNELMTDNVPKALAFYRKILGWETEEMTMPGGGKYTVVKAKGKPAGGMMNKADAGAAGAPNHWFAYIQVDDVDAAVAKVAGAGGKIHKPSFDVPGVGRIAIIEDPTGGMVGIMTAAPGT